MHYSSEIGIIINEKYKIIKNKNRKKYQQVSFAIFLPEILSITPIFKEKQVT